MNCSVIRLASCMSLLLAAGAPLAWARVPAVSSGLSAGNGERSPSELYLNAYRLCEEAESLALQQSYSEAIKKGAMAERILAGIVRDFPKWKSNIVSTRRNILAQNMEEYRKKAREAAIPTGRKPGSRLDRVPDIIERQNDAPSLPSYGEWVSGQERAVLKRGSAADAVVSRAKEPSMTPVGYDEIYEQLQQTRLELKTMVNAYNQMQKELNATKRQFIVAEDKQKAHKAAYDRLKGQIDTERAAGNEVMRSLTERLTRMEEEYRLSESRRTAAEARISQLERELEQTKGALDAVTRERDDLAEECRQLRAIVELNSPEKTKALLDQNLTLASQLQQAKSRIAELEAQATANADQTELLQNSLNESRAEIVRLKEELTALFDENMGYRRRISDLNNQLSSLEADLKKKADEPELDPVLIEENKLLREIVAKQKRTLQTQQQGRRLLIETYAGQNQQDPAMVEVIKRMEEESTVELTAAEQELIIAVAGNDAVGPDNEQKIADLAQRSGQAVRESIEIEALGKGAESAFSKGRYSAAEQLYRTLLEKRPDHLPSLVNMGTILMQRNKPMEAIEVFRRAIALAPDLAVPYYLCGSAMYRANQDDEAVAMFLRSVELNPAHADSFFYLGNLEGLHGEIDKALSHLAAAVRLNPELSDAHYNMARLYAEAGKIPDACRAYDRAIHAGAEPDPEFDNFLRTHPDRALAPGADLVAAPENASAGGVSKLEGASSETADKSTAAPRNPEWGIPDERGAEARAPQYKTVQVRIRGKKKRVTLRQRLREPRRLRMRSGDTYILKEES